MDDTPSTRPKPFAFVLIPFNVAFDNIFEYGIKAACDEAGAYCERVKDQQFHERILDRIYSQIDKADILIADMSGKNPNVFYEIGYAHGLGRNIILLTDSSDDIPFDFKHFPLIIYGGSINKLKEELLRRVKWAISNPVVEGGRMEPFAEFYLDQNLLGGAPVAIEDYAMKGLGG